jgi:hypothetical protein
MASGSSIISCRVFAMHRSQKRISDDNACHNMAAIFNIYGALSSTAVKRTVSILSS